MTKDTRGNLVKQGAIWAFIVVELVFFTVAGELLLIRYQSLMDLYNR